MCCGSQLLRLLIMLSYALGDQFDNDEHYSQSPIISSVNFITYQIILAQSDHINRRLLNQTKFKLILSSRKTKKKEWNKYEIFIFHLDPKFLSFYCRNLKSLSLKFKVQICANIYPQFSVILIKESRLPFISWRWWKLRWENISLQTKMWLYFSWPLLQLISTYYKLLCASILNSNREQTQSQLKLFCRNWFSRKIVWKLPTGKFKKDRLKKLLRIIFISVQN